MTQTDEHAESIREHVWDRLYESGPETIEQLSEDLQLSSQQIENAVNHAWFSRDGEHIIIAQQ